MRGEWRGVTRGEHLARLAHGLVLQPPPPPSPRLQGPCQVRTFTSLCLQRRPPAAALPARPGRRLRLPLLCWRRGCRACHRLRPSGRWPAERQTVAVYVGGCRSARAPPRSSANLRTSYTKAFNASGDDGLRRWPAAAELLRDALPRAPQENMTDFTFTDSIISCCSSCQAWSPRKPTHGRVRNTGKRAQLLVHSGR